MNRKNIITGKSAGSGIAKLMDDQRIGGRPFPEPSVVLNAAVLDEVLQMDDVFVLTLPFPPSMNAYWCQRELGNGQRTIVVTKAGKRFQNLVANLCGIRWRRPPIDYLVELEIRAWAPTKHYLKGGRYYWDVDNRIKPLEDALAKAGVLENDNVVRKVSIEDMGVQEPGRSEVKISRFRGFGSK